MIYENPYPKYDDDGELNPRWVEYEEKLEMAETLAEQLLEAERDERIWNDRWKFVRGSNA